MYLTSLIFDEVNQAVIGTTPNHLLQELVHVHDTMIIILVLREHSYPTTAVRALALVSFMCGSLYSFNMPCLMNC